MRTNLNITKISLYFYIDMQNYDFITFYFDLDFFLITIISLPPQDAARGTIPSTTWQFAHLILYIMTLRDNFFACHIVHNGIHAPCQISI